MSVELIWIMAATIAACWLIIWDARAEKQSPPPEDDPLAECSCSAM